ncbi:MAG: hypothetical protein FIA99_15530 [Ruminiclostridium sp.]|nr:hypothetical protein [Ruminiclostridium sp.]
MKRILTVLMISSLLLIFSACGQSGKALFPDMNRGTQQNSIGIEPTDTGSNNTGKDETLDTENQTDNTQAAATYTVDGNSNETADNGAKSGTGIIAKSDNIVTSQDKTAILKQLDTELDELFSSMNELEDVENSDLE